MSEMNEEKFKESRARRALYCAFLKKDPRLDHRLDQPSAFGFFFDWGFQSQFLVVSYRSFSNNLWHGRICAVATCAACCGIYIVFRPLPWWVDTWNCTVVGPRVFK